MLANMLLGALVGGAVGVVGLIASLVLLHVLTSDTLS